MSAAAAPSAKLKTSSQKEPGWVTSMKNHLQQTFDSNQSFFTHVVKSKEHFQIMRMLQLLQFEINKKFKPKFMWETATKPELQAVLAWIVVSDNMIKSSEESFLMAITAIQICTDKIDGNL